MQIKIGDKIRELRHRDGRKQEDLANALGVTNQAVSRWETNSSYPDLEVLPAIANYFHVSIDELFGYSMDREEKLKTILDKAEKALNEQGDMTECVEMLRAAAEEFPSESQVLIKLGYALNMHGWKKHGARMFTTDGSDYAHQDTDYNSKNEYWQEEIKIFEKVLTMDIPAEDRDTIIQMMVAVCALMGYNEKAVALAKKQNSLIMSRELLMLKATEAEERDKYSGEAIILLLIELKNTIVHSMQTKVSLFTTPVSVSLLLDLAYLFESIFSDSRCGIAHYHIGEIYLNASVYEARLGKREEYGNEYTLKAIEHFRKGFEHIQALKTIGHDGDYSYTAPLVSKVTFPCKESDCLSETFWEIQMGYFPDDIRGYIQSQPEFAECFNHKQ